jgi:hypothetical protein
LNDFQRILAVANHDDTTDGFGTRVVQCTPALCWPQRDVRDVGDPNRSVLTRGDDGLFEVPHRSNEAQASNEVLRAIDLESTRADIQVRLANGTGDLFDRHPTCEHGFRVDVDLVLLNVSSDRGDLRNARDGLQCKAHGPVLRGTELVQVPSADRLPLGSTSFEGVPKDLPERGGVWPERGCYVIGEGARRERSELLENARARPIELHTFLEDHVDGREAEHRGAPHRTDTGDPKQRGGQRIADLILDVAW